MTLLKTKSRFYFSKMLIKLWNPFDLKTLTGSKGSRGENIFGERLTFLIQKLSLNVQFVANDCNGAPQRSITHNKS